MRQICLYILLLTLILQKGVAQDLSNISLKGAPSLSGNVRVGSFFYNNFRAGEPTYAPLGYNLSGGLNFSWNGINVPVSFSFNHQNGQISSPFNLYGASPYYKWIKLHVGFRSLNYGPYVFSGKAFRGIGIELTPGKFRFSAFRGSIRNILAIDDPISVGIISLPSYQRQITGAQIGVSGKIAGFEFSGIKVEDQLGTALNPPLPPLENVVLGTKVYLKLLKVLSLEANVAASVVTQDLEARQIDNLNSTIKSFNWLVNPNTTTRFSFAGDASINYKLRGLVTGVKYRRIDPFFQSLGINFIQSDIENYTFNLGFPAFKRRLRFNGTFGLQRDNLLGYKAFTSSRTIGSASINYAAGRRFHFMLRYANYQLDNQSGLIQVNDTLKFVTVTRNFNIGTRIVVIENTISSTSININAFRNAVVTETGRPELNRNFIGSGLNGRLLYDLKSLFWGIGPVVNYNHFDYSDRVQTRFGTGLNISKGWLQNAINISSVILYNFDRIDNIDNGSFLNFSINATARMKGGHAFQFSFFYLDNAVITGLPFKETRGQLSYIYSFADLFKKKAP